MVVHKTYYNGDAMTQFASLPINGTGFISSLKVATRSRCLRAALVLEPPGEIYRHQVTFQTAMTALGPVGLGSTSGAIGRLGRTWLWTIVSDDDARHGSLMRVPILWRNWDAGTTTNVWY